MTNKKLIAEGGLRKMKANRSDDGKVEYFLPIGEESIPLTQYLDKTIQLHYQGKIHCINCGRKTNKSFSQGHCYVCFKGTAACDMCIMKPETCHFRAGTCREPDWAESNCMIDHYVYLSNTSGIKVGITRHSQIPTRWIDQGAMQAMPVMKVSERFFSGVIETTLSEHIADKTNWRALLKGEPEKVDLRAKWEELRPLVQEAAEGLNEEHGQGSAVYLEGDELEELFFEYPVNEYPTKISSFNLDKNDLVEGVLKGIKGQYLIFDNGVINIRKFAGYDCAFAEL